MNKFSYMWTRASTFLFFLIVGNGGDAALFHFFSIRFFFVRLPFILFNLIVYFARSPFSFPLCSPIWLPLLSLHWDSSYTKYVLKCSICSKPKSWLMCAFFSFHFLFHRHRCRFFFIRCVTLFRINFDALIPNIRKVFSPLVYSLGITATTKKGKKKANDNQCCTRIVVWKIYDETDA